MTLKKELEFDASLLDQGGYYKLCMDQDGLGRDMSYANGGYGDTGVRIIVSPIESGYAEIGQTTIKQGKQQVMTFVCPSCTAADPTKTPPDNLGDGKWSTLGVLVESAASCSGLGILTEIGQYSNGTSSNYLRKAISPGVENRYDLVVDTDHLPIGKQYLPLPTALRTLAAGFFEYFVTGEGMETRGP